MSAEISDIQRRMAQIRHEMHQEVQGAVKGAQSLTDWRSLVRSHPWLALGVAAAAGYLIVPRRRWDTPALMNAGVPVQAVAATSEQPARASPLAWSPLGTLASLVAPVAIRAAQNFALQKISEWLEHRPAQAAESPAAPRAQGGAARPLPAESPATLRAFR
jgi:hypothetical protein